MLPSSRRWRGFSRWCPRASLRTSRAAGFTIVELLVVLAILTVLLTLLLPAVQNARENARRTSCANNLKQLALAAKSHETLIGHLPTGGWSADWLGNPDLGSDWRQPGGWCFTVLPFADLKELYNQMGTDANQAVLTSASIFVCPSRRGNGLVPVGAGVSGPTGNGVNLTAAAWLHTDYAGNRGGWASSPATPTSANLNRTTTFGPVGNPITIDTYPSNATAALFSLVSATLATPQVIPVTGTSVATGGVIFAGSALTSASIRDGTSTTYLIAEKYVPAGQYETGLDSGDDQCAFVGDSPDTLRGGQSGPQADSIAKQSHFDGVFGGPHLGVFNAAMCDGSVRSVGFDVDSMVHFLLAARADRQTIQPPE